MSEGWESDRERGWEGETRGERVKYTNHMQLVCICLSTWVLARTRTHGCCLQKCGCVFYIYATVYSARNIERVIFSDQRVSRKNKCIQKPESLQSTFIKTLKNVFVLPQLLLDRDTCVCPPTVGTYGQGGDGLCDPHPQTASVCLAEERKRDGLQVFIPGSLR